MSITETGYRETNATLLALKDLPSKLIPFAERQNNTMTEQFKVYPPQLPAQKYIRTGQLGRSHRKQITVVSDGFISDLYSVGATRRGKPYEQWVQVKSTQARIHQGRWNNTDEGVLAQNINPIVNGYLVVIDEVLR